MTSVGRPLFFAKSSHSPYKARTSSIQFYLVLVLILAICQKTLTVSATMYAISSFETEFLTFSASCRRCRKCFITCLQSGSFAPVMEGEGCPINQKSVSFLVTGREELRPEESADEDGNSLTGIVHKEARLPFYRHYHF